MKNTNDLLPHKYLILSDIDVPQAIAVMSQDGLYRPTGNSRSFVGPCGERVTLMDGSRTHSYFTPWGTFPERKPGVRVVIANSQDADMVIKDLRITFDGEILHGRK